MNNVKHILKIEAEKGGVVLFSPNSNQELMPTMGSKIMRNINFEVLPGDEKFKRKSVIETTDPPDLSLLAFNKPFRIYSVVKLKESGASPSVAYVLDSIERYDGYIEYCPILTMFLVNFQYKPKNKSWFFEFEEP